MSGSMEVERINDVLEIDLFRPTAPANGAAVLLVHGGGWVTGDRSMMHAYGHLLAAKGFLAAAVQYRFVPADPWPAQLEDVRSAIRWIKAQGERLGVDPAKVTLAGFSAGGHLALLAAGTGDGTGNEQALGDGTGTSVAAVVGFYAPVALGGELAPFRTPPVDLLLAGGDEDHALALSPITYVNAAFPKTFLLSGDEDFGVPMHTTLRLFQDLVDAGARPELHIFREQTHEFAPLPSLIGPVIDEVAFFLQRAVVDPDHFIEENKRLNMFANPELMAEAMAAMMPAAT